ncbi:hypothetical protein MMC31_003572, partial [Peltigera leucophlebia]|nr:hypothetical protein [Peltigera leucophlebia]
MEVGKETTDQQPTAKGPQDKEAGGKSCKKGEYDEPVIQKYEPTEQQATQPVPGVPEAGRAHGDNHSKTNAVIKSSRVYANAQSVLEHTRKPAPIQSHLQPLSLLESKNNPLPTHLAIDEELSEYKAKVVRQEEELKAANAQFEMLQYHFSSLRKELQGCYREDPAGVFEEIRERLEEIAAAVRTNPVGSGVPDRKPSVNGGKPSKTESSKLASFANFPQRRDDCSSPVKAEKANLSVFSIFACFTNFLNIFKRGDSSSESNPQSTGSNTDTTDSTNPLDLSNPLSLSATDSDIWDNRQTSAEIGSPIALRELARKTVRQNSLILSKLNRQQPLISSSSTSHPPPISTLVPQTGSGTANSIPLIFLYTANIVLFLIFLVAIAWALAAG